MKFAEIRTIKLPRFYIKSCEIWHELTCNCEKCQVYVLRVKKDLCKFAVAPLVGAWIEIVWTDKQPAELVSLPSWERGLKLSAGVATVASTCRSPRGSVD